MVVFIASVAVGLILIVALLVYNMQAFTSSPPRRSERQYPLDPSPAEEPADARGTEANAEGGLSHVRRAGDQEPPSAAAEAAGNAEAAEVPGTVDAPRAIEAAQESGALEGAEAAEVSRTAEASRTAASSEAKADAARAPEAAEASAAGGVTWASAASAASAATGATRTTDASVASAAIGATRTPNASAASSPSAAAERPLESGALPSAKRPASAGVPASGSAGGSSDGRASADIEYREAIRRLQLQQPEEGPEPTAAEAAADAPMSDDDYRSALRRFGTRGKRG